MRSCPERKTKSRPSSGWTSLIEFTMPLMSQYLGAANTVNYGGGGVAPVFGGGGLSPPCFNNVGPNMAMAGSEGAFPPFDAYAGGADDLTDSDYNGNGMSTALTAQLAAQYQFSKHMMSINVEAMDIISRLLDGQRTVMQNQYILPANVMQPHAPPGFTSCSYGPPGGLPQPMTYGGPQFAAAFSNVLEIGQRDLAALKEKAMNAMRSFSMMNLAVNSHSQ